MTEQKQALFTILEQLVTSLRESSTLHSFVFSKKANWLKNFAVIGTARRPWTNDYYREVVLESIKGLMNSKTEAEKLRKPFLLSKS